MANNQFNDQWELLKQVGSTDKQKDVIRRRIRQSIAQAPSKARPFKFLHWKSIVAASLLVVIFGGFLFMLLEKSPKLNNADYFTVDDQLFSWNLEDVTSKKIGGQLELYYKNNPIPFGTVQELTETEKNATIASKSMFVNKELEHFPYKTNMYIEHVKMQDVAIRYYFFIPLTAEKWLQFTFDYPKLEYANIFKAMTTLELKGKKSYHHNEPLYVTYGYERMIYPVDLEPVSDTSSNYEVYRWEGASNKAYHQYVEKILQDVSWQKKSGKGLSTTFVSVVFQNEVTITLNGNELTYEYFYPEQDE
ncbi:hypothetical protein [Neobacillus vireti]|uniref:ECF-type sigma factor negative effector n=1 Tax=Neobacillus vireti LMG 21834 TaxID=1131730 RepID=A0AB94II90_9BACI|nr:hypothetical protein [Neobacillus vireti]ETI66742.1 hypothetical protein BAVI_21258 [Neobacillus vireti LMG 21834]KLT15820.1 hypothetical protein AA980_21655 [Neobacillus vireti]